MSRPGLPLLAPPPVGPESPASGQSSERQRSSPGRAHRGHSSPAGAREPRQLTRSRRPNKDVRGGDRVSHQANGGMAAFPFYSVVSVMYLLKTSVRTEKAFGISRCLAELTLNLDQQFHAGACGPRGNTRAPKTTRSDRSCRKIILVASEQSLFFFSSHLAAEGHVFVSNSHAITL